MTWNLKDFTFATVKGAGHMVPLDKRREAFVLLDSFINGVPLPDKS
jgi:carboxypeptidase C (cathepsin A)